MKARLYIFLILSLLTAIDCLSQQYNARSFSSAEGLSTYNIRKTLQDKYGFLWIATQNGIYRYDGKFFESFKKIPDDSNSIRGNFIFDMVPGNNEDLYVSVFTAGIDVINTRTLKVTHLLPNNDEQKKGLPSLWISKIYLDHFEKLWIGGKDYLSVYDTKAKTTKHITPEGYTKDEELNVSFIQPLDSNRIVVGIENYGLLVYDAKNARLISTIDKLDPAGIENENIISDMLMLNGQCYFSVGGTVYAGRINNRGWIFNKKYSNGLKKEVVINCLARGFENKIILGTSAGIAELDPGTSLITFIAGSEIDGEENYIHNLYRDSLKNLWISSLKNLQLIELERSPFHAYTEDRSSGVKMNHVYSLVAKSNDEIFACGSDGLYKCRLSDGAIRKINGSGSLDIIHYIMDYSSDLWIVATSYGMFGLDAKKELISKELLINQLPEWKNYSNLYFNNSVRVGNKIYLASEEQEGLIIWDTEKHTINKYKAEGEITKGVPENHMHNIKMDNDGYIWMLFDQSVARFDPKIDSVVEVITYSKGQKNFNSGIFFDLYDDGTVVWFGTYGGGLNGYNKSDKSWQYITEADGLCNNSVYGILPENDSIFWVSTNNGLSRVNFKIKKCINFYSENGLQSNFFDEKGALKVGDKLYFGGVNGFTSIDLSKNLRIDHPLKIYIKKVEYFTKNIKTTLNNLDWTKLVLPQGTSTAIIWLSAISFSGSKPIFSYKIDGFQDEFIPVGDDYKIELNALKKGDYVVSIRYLNEKGEFITGKLGIDIEVLPFWYQTWWFTLLVFFVSFGLLFFIVRLIYVDRLRKQRAVLEKQLAVQYERQRISAEMHDDIGAGLSGIRLMTEMTKQKIKDKETAEQVGKIYSSVGDVSSKMREVIWSLNTENDSLQNLIFYIQRQVRALLENYPSQLNFQLPQKIPDFSVSGEARRNIYLAVKEAVHNIIKHSGADKINISISCDKNLVISVSDNGVGMQRINEKAGNGLRNMEQRMENVNGELIINNHQGTNLIFTIPLNNAL